MSERLMERDWRFIIDSLLDVNMTSTVDAFASEVLDLLEYLIPADQHTFSPVEQIDNKTLITLDMKVRGMPALFKDEFIGGNYGNDAYFYGWGFYKQTITFRDSDLIPEDVRVSSRLYREIYEPQGIHYALRSRLIYKQKAVGDVSLFNTKESGDFSERDLYVLNMVAPHFAYKLGTLNEEVADRSVVPSITQAFEQYGLTAREQEIVLHLLDGVPDAALADKLYISNSTLKKHIYNIYKKMDVNSRVQLFNLLKD